MSQPVTTEPPPTLEMLYLDLDSCDPCREGRDSVDETAERVSATLSAVGRSLEVRVVPVSDVDQARALGLASSPSVRLNGQEVALGLDERRRSSCSLRADERVACRTFGWAGGRHPYPRAEMIADAVQRHLTGRSAAPEIVEPRSAVRGAVLVAGDAGWDDGRGVFNSRLDQRPEVVVVPESVSDVVAAVRFAAANSMQIVPQRTGHNAEPLGSLEGTILLRTDRMRGVRINPARRRVRVEAGAKWGDVVPRASELGLAALHGSTPDVSVAGYAMGGGVGWYGRKLGLAANSIIAFEIVTADGRSRYVDQHHDAELFWALRGGGGNFGVVTALDIQLYDIPEVYAGVLFFPWERSSEVLHAWRDWTATVPDEVTSVGRILQFPPLPDVPAPLRGQNFAVVEAVVIGDADRGAELLDPIRALGPAIDTFAMVPPAGIAELHMDPPDPLPYVGDGQMLGDLPAAAIDAFVEVAGPGSGSPLLSAEIRHLGGALARPQDHHGALASLDASFLTFGVGPTVDEQTYRVNRERLELLASALAPYDTGRQYLNFTEVTTDPARFYTPETYRRLRAAKAEFDPQNVFRANHPIPPAA